MIRSIRYAVFTALMLAAPAAIAKPLIIDHRDDGYHNGQNERVPADRGNHYGWSPVVYGFTQGPIRVDSDLLIRGARFSPGIRVFLGGEEMKPAITPTLIRFTVPRGTPDGALVLRFPGVIRPLNLGQVEVLGRWAHDGFRAWTPVKNEVQLYRLRMELSARELELARQQGRDALVERIRRERRAEIERHETVMNRLWAQFFARR